MNKFFGIGRLTKDPEMTQTQTGICVCKFTLAIDRKYGDKTADFLPIITWKNTAENCSKYLKKGSMVGVVGSVQTRSYEASDGSKRYVTEISADEVQFLSPKEEKEEEPKPTEKPNIRVLEQAELPF